MAKLPILDAVKAAIAFQRANWRQVWGVALLAAPFCILQQVGSATETDALRVLGGLPNVLVWLMGYGALMRIAFAEEHAGDPAFKLGPGGLQLGGIEGRVFLAMLLAGAILAVPLILVVIPAAAVTAMSGKTAVMAVLGLLIAAACFAALYLGLRLCLSAPATVARGRLQVLSTWPLTKGQVWPLLASALLIGLIFVLAAIVLLVPAAVLGAVSSAVLGERGGALAAGLFAGLAASAATAFVQLPLSAGLAAYCYRFLRPAGEA